jgi:excinuclease ABC subunit B
VADIMEAGYPGAPKNPRAYAKAAEEQGRYQGMSGAQLGKHVKQLEKQMYDHASNLEFEQAARLRDQIADLKTRI